MTTDSALTLKVSIQTQPLFHFLQDWIFLYEVFKLLAIGIEHLFCFAFNQLSCYGN